MTSMGTGRESNKSQHEHAHAVICDVTKSRNGGNRCSSTKNSGNAHVDLLPSLPGCCSQVFQRLGACSRV